MTHVRDKRLKRARRAASQVLAAPVPDAAANANRTGEIPEHLKVRIQLMMSLRRFIETCDMTQCEAADFFGLAQPRISNLVNLKTDQFSADLLIDLHARAGMTVQLEMELDAETDEPAS